MHNEGFLHSFRKYWAPILTAMIIYAGIMAGNQPKLGVDSPLFVALGLGMAVLCVEQLRSGTVGLLGQRFQRAANPLGYWIWVVLFGMMAYMMIRLGIGGQLQ